MPRSNTFYKIVSVVIAVVLWAYVIGDVNPTTTQTITDVPVQLLNVESLTARGLALSGEMNYVVDVVVEGKRGDLVKITANDIIANADVFGFSIGKNYIPVTVSAPDAVTVMEVKSPKINVAIEELVAVSKTVKVAFIGQTDDAKEAGSIITQPEVIEVSGAKSEVDAVSFIKAEINTSKLSENESTIQAKAIPVNKYGDIVENVRLSQIYIDVSARLFNLIEIPLNVEIIGEVAPIYEITNLSIPYSVKIKGTKSVLATVKELTAVPIDISQVSETSKLPVEIPLPESVELAFGYENLSVDISIKAVATKEFTYESSEIIVEGIDGVSKISITTPQITVKASGSEAVIRGLKKEDLEPYIDLDAESLLSATAKVMVRSEKQLGHIAADPVEVHITLNQE